MQDPLIWKVSAGPTPVFAQTTFPHVVKKSIFLAGPTSRDPAYDGWRPEAMEILAELGYGGHVFIPEAPDSQWNGAYEAQIEWEENGLERADVIVFWVPRDPDGKITGHEMPAFTTNYEFGHWMDSGKVVWGAPEWALKNRYPEYYASKLGVPMAKDLRSTLKLALDHLGEGAVRTGGEAQIPLNIWRRKEFQAWLTAQKAVGNRLDGARVCWAFYPRPNKLFCYTVHVNVWIEKEQRAKSNELVFYRPDVSSVVLYCLETDKVVLVREFRSPVRNEKAFVYELPSGSSIKETDNPLEVAAEEVFEETGLRLDPTRFKHHESRQLLATLSAHCSTLFSCELTIAEMDMLEADKKPHGNFVTDSKMTWVEVRTIQEIVDQGLVDWSTMGMIMRVIWGDTLKSDH